MANDHGSTVPKASGENIRTKRKIPNMILFILCRNIGSPMCGRDMKLNSSMQGLLFGLFFRRRIVVIVLIVVLIALLRIERINYYAKDPGLRISFTPAP